MNNWADVTLLVGAAVLLVAGGYALFAAYWLHWRPLKAYRARLATQRWWQREQERLAAIREDERLRRQRLREMRRYAPEVIKRLETAFTQLDVLHWYRSNDDPRRHAPRARVQKVRFEYCLVDVDQLYFKLRLPYATAPHVVLDKTFQDDVRLESGFPDLEFMTTERWGLWLRVPARGSRGGIPDWFMWHSAQTRRNAIDILKDRALGNLVIPVGMASGGRLTTIDLTKESDGPSILVAGRSGGGKSNLLNAMLCTLITRNSPNELQLYMIDMKHVELMSYENIPHLARAVALGEEEAIQVLDEVLGAMAERQRLLAGRGVRKLATWNKKFQSEALPYIVLVVDELAMLMASKTKIEKRGSVSSLAEAGLAKLTAVGRAYGIHCVLCTQRPSVDVVTGLIKANVPTRIALTVASPTDSMTIINNGMAAGLDPVGRCILYTGGRYTECQSPLITDAQIANAVRLACRYPLPKRSATNEHIWEIMAGQNWQGLAHLYEEGIKPEFGMSFDDFLRWYTGWAYSVLDMGPVIKRGEGRFIMVGAGLVQIDDAPPATLGDLQQMEVLHG
jgi:hypothetical protein